MKKHLSLGILLAALTSLAGTAYATSSVSTTASPNGAQQAQSLAPQDSNSTATSDTQLTDADDDTKANKNKKTTSLATLNHQHHTTIYTAPH